MVFDPSVCLPSFVSHKPSDKFMHTKNLRDITEKR